MLTTISKQFRWEMGHRLPNHEGLCKNLHGHSYEAHIIITGEPDSSGMVMDYFDVSTLTKPIIDELDHCFIVDSSDEVMTNFFQQNKLKTVVVDFPTTAENIALFLLNRIAPEFKNHPNVSTVAVRVFETEKTYAEVKTNIIH